MALAPVMQKLWEQPHHEILMRKSVWRRVRLIIGLHVGISIYPHT